MAKHKVAYSRQLISWDELIGEFGDCALVPMPYSVWVVARKLLAERGLWQSTFYVGNPEPNFTFYESPEYTDQNWLIWQDELSTFLFDSGEFMTKFTDLIAQQALIEDAIRDLQEFMRTSIGTGMSNGVLPGNASYPIDNPGYIPPGLTEGEIATGVCNGANWIWDAFSSACTEIDDIVADLLDNDMSSIIIAVAEGVNAVFGILPDDIANYIKRFPALTMANIIDNLDENEAPTKAALVEIWGGESHIQSAFSWIDNTTDSAGIGMAKLIIHALATVAIDGSRWFNIPDNTSCGDCEVDAVNSFYETVTGGSLCSSGIKTIRSIDMGLNQNGIEIDYLQAGVSVRLLSIESKTWITAGYPFYVTNQSDTELYAADVPMTIGVWYDNVKRFSVGKVEDVNLPQYIAEIEVLL